MSNSISQSFAWFCKFLFIHLMTMQMAFGHVIMRLPAGQRYSLSIDELRLKIKDFHAIIHGKDSEPDCELVELQSYDLNQEVNGTIASQSIAIDDYERLSQEFFEEVEYILTQSSKGVMSKEDVDKEILNPALERGLNEEQLLNILDQTAHLPNFVEAFQEKVADFEEAAQRRATTIELGTNTKRNWKQVLSDMKRNACGHYITSTQWHNKPIEEGQGENCQVKHIDGDIDRFSKEMMRLEEQEQIMGHLNETDPLLNERLDQARTLQQEVEKYIADNDFPVDLRQKVFVEYLENVALPFRDLIIARRAYIKDELSLNGYYDALLSAIPISLVTEKGASFIKKIQDGTNAFFASNSLKVLEQRYDGKAGSYITGYRLEYDKTKIYYRDLRTLMHAPTKRNYIQALKWMTLGMMASQGLTYNAILGEDEKGYELPKSCQGDDQSDLPTNFWVADEGMNRAQILDSIVDNLKILPGFEQEYGNRAKAIDYTAIETYLTNTKGNPYENGYAGISPLERYVWADYGLKHPAYGPYGRPEFDDKNGFVSVIQQKMPKIMEIYEKERTTRSRKSSGRKKYTLTYKDIEELQMILKPAKSGMRYEVDGGGSFVASAFNLSEFLADRMQREGFTKIEDLTQLIKHKLQKDVTHPFPGFYGSTIWKQVALQKMAEYLEGHVGAEKRSRIYRTIVQACTEYQANNTSYASYNSGYYSGAGSITINSFCEGDSDHYIKNIFDKIKYFISKEKYVAIKKYEEIGLKQKWSVLGKIWFSLARRTDDFKAGREKEYDFLMRSLKAGNKWAMARLGYVYFMEELSEIRAQYDPEYVSTRRGRRLNSNSTCYLRNIHTRMKNLLDAGEELEIHKPIARFHGTKILKTKEKRAIFETTLSQFDSAQMSMGLFTAEIKNNKAFKVLNDIGYENLFSKEKVTNFAKEKFGENLTPAAQREMNLYLETHEAKITDFFVDILNPEKDSRNYNDRVEQHEEDLVSFLRVYGDPASFNSKESLILRDNQFKRILAKDVIRRAVKAKKNELREAIAQFCRLDKDDHEQAKTIFYAASQNQVRLNQLLGLDNEVLQKINENINALSKEEKQDIWILAALSMAAIMIGALCTAGTGGLCAPIGVAMMAAGVGALALQYDLFQRELTRKFNADEYEEYVNRMEGLGFANKGSSDAVSRWWTWTIIEGLGFIPLFNIVFKSIGAGSKVVAATSRAFFKQLSKQGAKWSNIKKAWRMSGRAGNVAYREWDIKIAHALLGLSNVDDAIDGGLEVAERVAKGTKAAEEAADNLKKIKALHDSGKISLREVMRQVSKQLENLSTAAIKNYDDAGKLKTLITKVDVRQLNRATAQQMANYWGGKTGDFLKYFKSYWGKWTVSSANAAYRGDKIKYAVDMVAKAKRKEFWFGKNWWIKFRFGHMADVADDMVAMRRHLQTLESTGKLTINGRVVTTLEGYFLENIEQVSKVFMQMPVRKRELPFMIFWLGGPEITSPTLARMTGIKWLKSGKALRYGGMHWMGNGIAMRKLINSRAIILSEIQRNVVNNILKVPAEVAPQLFAYSMTRFSQSMDLVAESIVKQQLDQVGIENLDDLVKRFGINENKLQELMEIIMRSETNEELGEAVGKLGLSIKEHNQVIGLFQPIFEQKAKFTGKVRNMKLQSAMQAKQMISGSPRLRDDLMSAVMAIFDTVRRKDGSFKHIFKIFPSMFSAADKLLSPSTAADVRRLLDLDVDTLVRVMWEPATDAEVMLAESLWRKIQPQTFLKGIPEQEFAHEAGSVLLKEMDGFKNNSHRLLDEVGADEAFDEFYNYYLNALKMQVMQKNPGFIDYF